MWSLSEETSVEPDIQLSDQDRESIEHSVDGSETSVLWSSSNVPSLPSSSSLSQETRVNPTESDINNESIGPGGENTESSSSWKIKPTEVEVTTTRQTQTNENKIVCQEEVRNYLAWLPSANEVAER